MFACIPTRLRNDPNITGSHIAVYYELATYANPETKSCWPGRERVAKELQFSVRKVHDLIKDLEKLGYIKITRGEHKTLSYYLVPVEKLPAFKELDTEKDDTEATVLVESESLDLASRPANIADKQDQDNILNTSNTTTNVSCIEDSRKRNIKEKEVYDIVDHKIPISKSSQLAAKINIIMNAEIIQLSDGEKLCRAFWQVCDKTPSTLRSLMENWIPVFVQLAEDGKTPGEVKFATRKLIRKFNNLAAHNPMNLAKWWDELIDGQQFVTVDGVTRPIATGDSEAWMHTRLQRR